MVQFGFQVHRCAMNVCLKARDSQTNRLTLILVAVQFFKPHHYLCRRQLEREPNAKSKTAALESTDLEPPRP